MIRRTFLRLGALLALTWVGCKRSSTTRADVGDPYEVVDDYYGLTRLHIAARDGNLTLLETFLQNGADPNTPDTSAKGIGGKSTARSPIHWALDEDTVDVLVEYGADITYSAGAPPNSAIAHLAYRNRHSAVARLLELGASVNERDELGQSPLLWCMTGLALGIPDDKIHEDKDLRLKTACLLIENGADINQSDSGSTALGSAIKFAPEFIPRFLELGADPELLDNGKSPLTWATDWENETAIQQIKKAIESKKNAE